jgi:Fe2+ or Zn2+ uptake regulation protein
MKVNTQDMRHKILGIVSWSPSAANDDKLLIAKIWEQEGWDYMEDIYSNLRRVSSPETIRRTRQRLVEEGLIEPSKTVTERRYKDFKEARVAL